MCLDYFYSAFRTFRRCLNGVRVTSMQTNRSSHLCLFVSQSRLACDYFVTFQLCLANHRCFVFVVVFLRKLQTNKYITFLTVFIKSGRHVELSGRGWGIAGNIRRGAGLSVSRTRLLSFLRKPPRIR
ncbi:hypothetical protein IscW_ISCW003235 [Ixodes scapularis]|uniref:Uncharacterized protein n=1 Tax=Ixodes scapularis TaxID=6945 RepID=B7PBM4_IXOSC|nr:hypothetical protein IscW_ISCW003235 [Ixodes scapularis]|eukprot:XP_002408564.1 hypothetical protein IscW_ISCW003235 [Ixodes scapularis]